MTGLLLIAVGQKIDFCANFQPKSTHTLHTQHKFNISISIWCKAHIYYRWFVPFVIVHAAVSSYDELFFHPLSRFMPKTGMLARKQDNTMWLRIAIKKLSTFYPRVIHSFHMLAVVHPKNSVYCWLSFMSLGVLTAIRHTWYFRIYLFYSNYNQTSQVKLNFIRYITVL